jgi:hypothetical protein
MEKWILKGIGVVVLFVVLIQASIFVFNNIDAWVGIVSGVVSIGVTYILARVVIKQVTKK